MSSSLMSSSLFSHSIEATTANNPSAIATLNVAMNVAGLE